MIVMTFDRKTSQFNFVLKQFCGKISYLLAAANTNITLTILWLASNVVFAVVRIKYVIF